MLPYVGVILVEHDLLAGISIQLYRRANSGGDIHGHGAMGGLERRKSNPEIGKRV